MKQRILLHQDSGSGDAAGSGDWVAAADEADDAVPGENDDQCVCRNLIMS